jgi:phage tail P2-like protein
MLMSKITPINDLNLKVIDEILNERLSNLDLACLLVTIIDDVPADALPHLAEQYHVTGNEGWLQTRNDTEKRDLIKRAIEVHRYKGTKYALTKIFDMFGIEGQIQEWFETGGEPFTFSVDINFVSKGLDYNLISKLEDLIKEYKNVRSHLSMMNISMSTSPKTVEIKSAVITGENVIVFPKPANLIWDEFNWDERNWSTKRETLSSTKVLRFDETNFDDTTWAFG